MLSNLLTFIATSVIWGSLIAWVTKNPDKAWLLLEKLATFLKRWSKRAELQAVSSNIQGHIIRVAKAINNIAGEVMPHGLKVEWVVESQREVFLKNNEVVIRMDYHQNQSRNLALVTVQYVKWGLLPQAKHYMDPVLTEGLELATTRHILVEEDHHSLQYFLTEILDPKIKGNQALRERLRQLSEIDEKGLFVSLVLRQLADLGRSLYPRAAPLDVYDEVDEFIIYACTLAQRKVGEEVNLGFIGRYIRCGVILLAKSWKIEALGPQAYVIRASKYISEGAQVLYILGWEPYIEHARTVSEAIRQQFGAESVLERQFWVRGEHKDTRHTCIMIQVKDVVSTSGERLTKIVTDDEVEAGAAVVSAEAEQSFPAAN